MTKMVEEAIEALRQLPEDQQESVARAILDYASRDELLACLDHLLETAGNPALMTSELKATLAEHAAGNYRVLMNLADELLAAAAERDQPQLDEKLFFEVFAPPQPKKNAPAKKR